MSQDVPTTCEAETTFDEIHEDDFYTPEPLVKKPSRPSRAEAEAAVEVLIRWAGDDPGREGLLETPARVARAYEDFFRGYRENPDQILSKTFEEVQGYDEMVLLKNMRLESYCEHHMVPIIGVTHVAYLPDQRVVGISKLARLVDCFGKRLQTQETMTSQIADTLERVLKPRGVAVFVDAKHQCMTTRGVHKTEAGTITTRMTGEFKTNMLMRQEFMTLVTSSAVGV